MFFISDHQRSSAVSSALIPLIRSARRLVPHLMFPFSLRHWLTLIALALFAPASGEAMAKLAPVPIIFDTDMDSDCDDAAALAMLHALADRGEVKILATTVSSKHTWSVPCTDAINTYFGRPDLPIGAPRGAGPKEQGSRYAKEIATEFPHDLRSTETAPDATT